MSELETPRPKPPVTVADERIPSASPSADGALAPQGDGAREDTEGAGLGPLNRHWYRRCLDALNKSLRDTPEDPSIAQLQELYDRVVTGFLTAVTGQAPDSEGLQFPADRAYYFPFAGDGADRFNFAKCMFKLPALGNENSLDLVLRDSLWSFLPFVPDGLAGAKPKRVWIDPESSVDAKERTHLFEEVISLGSSLGEGASQAATERGAGSGDGVRATKSLILRGKDEVWQDVFGGDTNRGASAEERAASAEDRVVLGSEIDTALLAMFDLYRLMPGNSAVESYLLHQAFVVRWLSARLGGETTSTRDDFEDLIRAFLRAYFLGLPPPAGKGGASAPGVATDLREARAVQIEDGFRPSEAGKPGLDPKQRLKLVEDAVAASLTSPWLAAAQGKRENLVKEAYGFCCQFLQPEREAVLDKELGSALAGKHLRVGAVEESYVAVCRDYAEFSWNLPEVYRRGRGKDAQVARQELGEARRLAAAVARPYMRFCRMFDRVCLTRAERKTAIEAYWRALGKAGASTRVFVSFDDDVSRGVGLEAPPEAPESTRAPHAHQTIFLRVRVCDSLNEPVLNGLFAFTSDWDDRSIRGKDGAICEEDVQDLLAFSKVYFFIVRDFLRALDRARESAEIGRLNQHMFDEQMQALDRAMAVYGADAASAGAAGEKRPSGGLKNRAIWDRFTYDVVNTYARALIASPGDVRIETFPYDRLLVFPLRAEAPDVDAKFALPFYLFQSIFTEVGGERVHKERYSLIKPFQSPVEDLQDEKGSRRFESKSFQRVTGRESDKRGLERYLVKQYVGAEESNAAAAGPEGAKGRLGSQPAVSCVVKAPPVSLGAPPVDAGRTWAETALRAFWAESLSHGDDLKWPEWKRIWDGFLLSLTAQYRRVRDGATADPAEKRNLLMRLALLRELLQQRTVPTTADGSPPAAPSLHRVPVEGPDPERWAQVEKTYSEALKLQFGADPSVDVIRLALRNGEANPFAALCRGEGGVDGRKEGRLPFSSGSLQGDEDPFLLAFFESLTRRVTEPGATWFQPTLTRPLEGLTLEGLEEDESVIGHVIGSRRPDYAQVRARASAVSMFLGVVDLNPTEGEDRQDLRLLVCMVRDYDDTKTGRGVSKSEIEARLEKDRKDLALFTGTYFNSVRKFVKEAVTGEEVRVLSTEVAQIARNWYSTGIDAISGALDVSLQGLLRRSAPLGRLQPDTVEAFVRGVQDVLVRNEVGPSGDPIQLESFPFDRLLHIPLLLAGGEAALLGYARTQVEWPGAASPNSAAAASVRNKDPYRWIRENGRIWPTKDDGRKETATRVFLDRAAPRSAGAKPENFATELWPARAQEFSRLVEPLLSGADGQGQRCMDTLVRRLYRDDGLPAVALAGLVLHMLSMQARGPSAPTVREAIDRMRQALTETIQRVERVVGAGDPGEVRTAVHTVEGVRVLPGRGAVADAPGGDLHDVIESAERVPFLDGVFRALDGPDRFRYGLELPDPDGAPVASRAIYVYYSLPAPSAFEDDLEKDRRYRGVFCLLLDDETTDRKTPMAMASDREDIRTFLHNAAGRLRAFLERQALHHQIQQPGVEQFTIGVLHRLKNDLSVPSHALYAVRTEVMKSSRLPEKERRRHEQSILAGERTIEGVAGLFKDLKQLTEVRPDRILLEAFSSDWLAWFFALKTCEAFAQLVQRGKDEGSISVAGADRAHEILERTLKAADRGLLFTPEAFGSPHRAGRLLRDVEEALRLALADREGGARIDFALSYDVFEKAPLSFRGSSHLDEALRILVENAAQALWLYIQAKLSTAARDPVVARMGMVCRRSKAEGDEIEIEVTNSTTEIPDAILKHLNSQAPAPISKQQHGTMSGKKGGSGFGHFYARRIVRELCGGRQYQRPLDIDVRPDPSHELVTLRVRLLERRSLGVAAIDEAALMADVTQVLRDRLGPTRASVLAPELGRAGVEGQMIALPKEIERRALFDAAVQLLESWKSSLLDKICSHFDNNICWTLDRAAGLKFRALAAALAALSAKARRGSEPAPEERPLYARELANPSRSTYFDLRRVLEDWRRESSATLREALATDPDLARTLTGFLESGILDPCALLSAKELSQALVPLRPHLSIFRAELRQDPVREMLRSVEAGDGGRAVVPLKAISDALEEEAWSLVATSSRETGDAFRCAIRLSLSPDAPPLSAPLPGADCAAPVPPNSEMAGDFRRIHDKRGAIGRVFLHYQRLLAEEREAPGCRLWALDSNSQTVRSAAPLYWTVHLVVARYVKPTLTPVVGG